MVQRVQPDADDRTVQALATDAAVRRTSGSAPPAAARHAANDRERAEHDARPRRPTLATALNAVVQPEVQRPRDRARSPHQRHPRDSARGEVGPDHRTQRPRLQVLALDRRDRGGSRAPLGTAGGRGRCPRSRARGSASRRSRRRRRTRPRRTAPRPVQNVAVGPAFALVHVVVEQVAEGRDRRRHRGRVVVGAETAVGRGIGERSRGCDRGRRGAPPRRRRRTPARRGAPGGTGVAGLDGGELRSGRRRRRPRRRARSAARRALRQRSSVAGRLVAGTTTESGEHRRRLFGKPHLSHPGRSQSHGENGPVGRVGPPTVTASAPNRRSSRAWRRCSVSWVTNMTPPSGRKRPLHVGQWQSSFQASATRGTSADEIVTAPHAGDRVSPTGAIDRGIEAVHQAVAELELVGRAPGTRRRATPSRTTASATTTIAITVERRHSEVTAHAAPTPASTHDDRGCGKQESAQRGVAEHRAHRDDEHRQTAAERREHEHHAVATARSRARPRTPRRATRSTAPCRRRAPAHRGSGVPSDATTRAASAPCHGLPEPHQSPPNHSTGTSGEQRRPDTSGARGPRRHSTTRRTRARKGHASGRSSASRNTRNSASRRRPARWHSIAQTASAAVTAAVCPSSTTRRKRTSASGVSTRSSAAATPAAVPARRTPSRYTPTTASRPAVRATSSQSVGAASPVSDEHARDHAPAAASTTGRRRWRGRGGRPRGPRPARPTRRTPGSRDRKRQGRDRRRRRRPRAIGVRHDGAARRVGVTAMLRRASRRCSGANVATGPSTMTATSSPTVPRVRAARSGCAARDRSASRTRVTWSWPRKVRARSTRAVAAPGCGTSRRTESGRMTTSTAPSRATVGRQRAELALDGAVAAAMPGSTSASPRNSAIQRDAGCR